MNDDAMPRSSKAVRKYLISIGLIVALIIVSVFWGFNLRLDNLIQKQLLQNSRAFFEEIVITRLWLSSHQGVYVPQKQGDEAYPYLQFVPGLKTTIRDAAGQMYVLKNPAQVTREISEIADRKGIFKFHITSLDPLNPGNAPDPFERRALEAFAGGVKESFTFEESGPTVYFRYMAPLTTEASCLPCHVHQGYKVGDVRGGISVSIPAGDVVSQMRANKIYLAASVLGVIFIIILIIYFIARYFIRDLDLAEQKLFNMATTDALTGLYNRREGLRLIEIETVRAKRIQTAICAMMLDIDHFKKVNDTYGHQIGDDILKGVASIIQKTLRASDIVCRYGGEEFLILATETNVENAKSLAERIRSRVEKEAILAAEQIPISVTVSMGLVQYQPEETYEYMIFRADQALYQAKNNGRNRVCIG